MSETPGKTIKKMLEAQQITSKIQLIPLAKTCDTDKYIFRYNTEISVSLSSLNGEERLKKELILKVKGAIRDLKDYLVKIEVQ